MEQALIGYCYRMLGSAFEAEDAVRKTLNRRAADRLELFTVATTVCLDMLGRARPRARVVDLYPPSPASAPLGAPLPETALVQPIPDSWLDPAEPRETVRLAFIAALQRLSPRQRAVLILRDVLCWKTSEVAVIIGATVPSVNSALQRARATMRAADLWPTEQADHGGLLARYAEALERGDVPTLVSLLHEDARMSMPPFTRWLRGRPEIERTLRADGDRLVLVMANRSVAFGQYRPGRSGRLEPFALALFEIAGGLIVELTSYLDAARLFPLFGLTNEFPGGDRY